MKPQDIKPFDWARILMGEAPPEFLIEVLLRTVFLFILLLVSMRLFGRRFATQLSRIEVLSLFALAAAIGVPLQTPDRGLLPAVVIALVTIGLGRGIARLASKNEKFAAFAEDDHVNLVVDGVVQWRTMMQTRITIELLFGELRQREVRHLGEVRRFYLEADGSFSLVRTPEPRPGLAVLPAIDRAFLDEQEGADILLCHCCGSEKPARPGDANTCPQCGEKKFVTAIW
jgi:hypothetical protein